jgi:beta-glucosidase-like glycosyl hydrolase/CubicO group peptidase (beta-lactamase class C family)
VLSAFAATPRETWAESTLKRLSLRDKIAQLIQIRVPGKFLNAQSEDFKNIRNHIEKHHVGGVVLFAGNIYESAVLLNNLQGISKLPLLVSADFERGVSFRIADATSFPWTMALGAAGSEQFAYQQGLITARESRAMGVHWIFAPVMDVNSNPNNPVINIRSFGEDPGLVSRLGAAFIRGAKAGGVLTTAKHFPGHGDTATDSHIGLAVVQSDKSRLQSVELLPFRSAIDAGVDSIMTAHVAVPKITGDVRVPATLSSKILTDLLRNSLNFSGIVVTDAMEMAGITNSYWCGLAAIRAIQAGADILLLPPDAMVAINEVERAVISGLIPRSRIDASVGKILAAKSRLGLQRRRMVDFNQIARVIASPKSVKLAQDIADRSITVVNDENELLPVDPTTYPRILSLALTPDLDSSPAAVFQSEIRQRYPLTRTLWANARVSEEFLGSIDRAIAEADMIVCSAVIRLVTGQTASTLTPSHRIIFDKLIASHKPLIWVAFGNPYIFQLVPKSGTFLCTFSNSDVSQIAAARAISGEIEITGRMPITVPGHSKAGDGKTISKLDMRLKPVSAEELGLSKIDFGRTSQLLDALVDSGEFPGAVLLVGSKGKILYHHAFGKIGSAADSQGTTPGTVYNIASLAKPVGISTAIMLTADSGKLLLDASVIDYVPEAKNAAIEMLRIMDLLKTQANEDLLETILNRSTGVQPESYLAEKLFSPLGMHSTFYKLPLHSSTIIAPSAEPQKAGLFSNAQDLAGYAQMLLNRGIYNHRRYISLETINRFTGAQSPWTKPAGTDWTGTIFSPSAFGHSANSGSLLWIDPVKKLFIVLLANGNPNNGNILEAQKKICESILSSIPE